MTLTAERPTGQQPREERPAAQPHRFRADVEGLRAVAVGLVLLDHVLGRPSGGFVGVDVFFVISGFLITGLLVRERERTGRISFRAFYVRRARRLMPAAVATLAATSLAAWLLFLGGRFQETLTDAAWALAFGANVHFAQQGTDYFQQTAAPSPVQHFWSLAVEEQFYLAWPLLILLVVAVAGRGRSARPLLAAAFLAVVAASFLWSVHASAVSPATAYFSTFTRAWELGAGALVAVTATQLRRLPGALRAALAWAGLLGVLASATVITSADPFPGSVAALPVLSTVLLVAFGEAPGGPGTRWVLGSVPARFLGRISYSLYLWHWPVVVFTAAVLGAGTVTTAVVAIVVSLVLATVSYAAIEQPVLHSGWLLPGGRPPGPQHRAAAVRRRGRLVAAATATVLVVGGAGLTVAFPPGRLDAQAVAAAGAAAQAATEGDPLTRDLRASAALVAWPADLQPALDELPGYLEEQWSGGCFDVGDWNADRCVFGDPGARHSAVLLGDSVAGAWLPGLRAAMEPQGWSIRTLTMGQCPNVDAVTLYQGRPFTECAEHREWALDLIDRTRPELVVLSHTYDTRLADPDADKAAVWEQGMTSVVQRIQQSGARVVVLTGPPSGANLQTCATTVSTPADCVQEPPRRFMQQVAVEEDVAEATGATFVDPERWFCVDDLCPAVVGSTPVYADGLHMTAEYAERIAPEVGAAVLGTA
ncbi:acyltransferase family protein [Geodermatophilus sp. SYSU D00684]